MTLLSREFSPTLPRSNLPIRRLHGWTVGQSLGAQSQCAAPTCILRGCQHDLCDNHLNTTAELLAGKPRAGGEGGFCLCLREVFEGGGLGVGRSEEC